MTPDERAQLIEDIKRSASMREHLVEQAESDPDFDIAAGWEEVAELDASIARRL